MVCKISFDFTLICKYNEKRGKGSKDNRHLVTQISKCAKFEGQNIMISHNIVVFLEQNS